MKVAILFSGGKDSCYAMHLAMQQHEPACLVTIVPEKPDSYMFHYPNIHLVDAQAALIGLPLIKKTTKAEKEKELEDLKKALQEAKQKYKIKGVVSGAIASNYQKTRVDKICEELGLESIAPLWGKNQEQLIKEEAKILE
ncbi:diphthine--ammonia ligase, partial [archaeon]|nr:diphthine--ammonia ligase [archaeon]